MPAEPWALREVVGQDVVGASTGLPASMRPWTSRPGNVRGLVTQRHQAADFLAFLTKTARVVPRGLRPTLGDSSTHTTAAVCEWLAAHPRFTPTSAAWLAAVEACFALLERRAVHRGSFGSVAGLRAELRRSIAAWPVGGMERAGGRS